MHLRTEVEQQHAIVTDNTSNLSVNESSVKSLADTIECLTLEYALSDVDRISLDEVFRSIFFM